jgi:protein-S-isoprenylcysteine O-methyltransferase Ste14
MNIDTGGQRVNEPETAGVVARPPLIFLAALVLGFAMDPLLQLSYIYYQLPLPIQIPRTDLHRIISGSLILIGIMVFAASIRDFSKAGTPVQGTKPTRALVTSGIFGWSRNPIYLGMFLFYIGIGVAVRSLPILILALPLAIIMHYGVIVREEAYLERRFGDAYRNYKARVRRWL